MTYSIPHGIDVPPPSSFTPSARVAAEYAEFDRDYLLARIEELEDSESALSSELAAEHAKARRVEAAALAIIGIALHGDTHLLLTQAELDARIAEAMPKRGRKAKGAEPC